MTPSFNWVDLLFDPRVALFIFLAYCIGYLVFIDEENALEDGFMNFGPGPDTVFMKIKLDTWGKVFSVYAISFLTALMEGYYETSMATGFHQQLADPELALPVSQTWAFAIVTFDHVIGLLLQIINFMLIQTLQLQFLLPGLLADVFVGIFETKLFISKKY